MPGINRKVFKALQKREKKRCLIKERIFDWHENSNPQHQMLDILSKEIFRTLHPGISWFKRIWKNAKIQKVYFVLSHFSHVWVFATPWTAACQPPLSMGFSRQENWSGLPCPPPGDLLDPGIKPEFLTSNLHWQEGSLPLAPPRKPKRLTNQQFIWKELLKTVFQKMNKWEENKDLWTEKTT